jgi:hypothetical protein
MPILAKQGSANDLLKRVGDSDGKENLRKREGMMTERARAGTLSPSNPENERRMSSNMKM